MTFRVPTGSLPTLKKLKPFAYLEISIYVALQTETGPLFVGVEWKFGEWRDNSVVLVIGSTFKITRIVRDIIRNLDVPRLRNGTWFQITHLGPNVVLDTDMTGMARGESDKFHAFR
ncbi:hypothetical protein AVEN_134262-1 [Araneus ventricosus]|uniref:Uncharacterized protein n=1 Tax=Araneus ventricosus TaxID=182803 RepID=A0A4Y2R5P4_ARAVE|nr:hypothetical protein AVEN_134262-1 [Araneus ventricosus]